jgi:abortive infection bacteriophage resistance protein
MKRDCYVILPNMMPAAAHGLEDNIFTNHGYLGRKLNQKEYMRVKKYFDALVKENNPPTFKYAYRFSHIAKKWMLDSILE